MTSRWTAAGVWLRWRGSSVRSLRGRSGWGWGRPVLVWVAKASRPLVALHDPALARNVLEALRLKRDGNAAAPMWSALQVNLNPVAVSPVNPASVAFTWAKTATPETSRSVSLDGQESGTCRRPGLGGQPAAQTVPLRVKGAGWAKLPV
jgi:hypothetical protein